MGRHNTSAIVLSLFLAGGAAQSLYAQQGDPARPGEVQRGAAVRQAMLDLTKAADLIGADVQDASGENAASIDDLIFERGTGRITHAVLESGGVAGIGARKIAVPYESLAWNAAEEAFFSGMTEERIEGAAEFDPDTWPGLDHTSWMQDMRTWWSDEPDAAPIADHGRYGDTAIGESRTITGTVRSIERCGMGDGPDEETVVKIETDAGQTHKVALGPTWYIYGQDSLPYRGQEVTLVVHPLDGDGEADFVATRIGGPGEGTDLRDAAGQPVWSETRQAPTRLMLMSDLTGAEVTMPSEEETGEVQSVIVDRESGRIVLIGLDPNENFLGIADSIKSVPWPVVRVLAPDEVRVDADPDMLRDSPDLPEDLTTWRTTAQIEPVYERFGVSVVPLERDQWSMNDDRDGGIPATNGTSPAVRALASGEDFEISGQVRDVSQTQLAGFDGTVTVATISTDEGDRRVVLGPSRHFAANPHGLAAGDQVSIGAKRAELHGHEVIAACTVEHEGRRLTLWRDGAPVWDRT